MSSERLALIRQRIEADIARDQLPGGVLAIARRGKLVHFEAYGFLDKAAGVPMRTDAIFNIASMTKPMAAVAALQLYEQGRLLIDDPVSKYFPKFANTQVAVLDAKKETIVERVPAARPITIQDLFRHTSGLVYGGRGTTPVHKFFPSGSTPAASRMTSAEFIDQLAAAPLLHQPGAVWDYGFGLDVLGLIVEQLTEQSLGRYLQENVWKPLGMSDTQFVIPADKVARYAKALPIDPDTQKPQSLHSFVKPSKYECGGGCTTSTADDYLRFALMLANKGTYANQRVLGRKTVEYMTANHLGVDVVNRIGETGDPTRADYGFGLGVAVRTLPGISRTMELGRHLLLAGRQRHQLVGRSARRADGGLDGAHAGLQALALPAGDQRHGVFGAGRLSANATLAGSRITYVSAKFHRPLYSSPRGATRVEWAWPRIG